MSFLWQQRTSCWIQGRELHPSAELKDCALLFLCLSLSCWFLDKLFVTNEFQALLETSSITETGSELFMTYSAFFSEGVEEVHVKN